MVNETIPQLFNLLQQQSTQLGEAKRKVIDDLDALIALKKETFGTEKIESQYSNTFTTDEGLTITVGCNINDGWDDTVTEGMTKINHWLAGKSDNELSGFVKDLLSKDAKGNLNSKKVLTLKKRADQIGDLELIEGVSIITEAYRPIRSKEYIKCSYRDAHGATVNIPLNITEVK